MQLTSCLQLDLTNNWNSPDQGLMTTFSQPLALVLQGRFSHALQNGEAKGFTCVANQLLESVADPERLGIWRLNMSSIWLLSEWAGEGGAILVYVSASSLSDI